MVCSIKNNNHSIRTVQRQYNYQYDTINDLKIKDEAAKKQLLQNFDHWLMKRTSDSDTEQVFLVACEGGGIRSAYYTAAVLAQLQINNPGFMHHVYAISGVSGGSLGAAVIALLYAKMLKSKSNCLKQCYDTERRDALDDDFLSPLAADAFGGDMLARIIPFPIHGFDRARALEDAWADAWPDRKGLNLLNRSLEDIFTDSSICD